MNIYAREKAAPSIPLNMSLSLKLIRTKLKFCFIVRTYTAFKPTCNYFPRYIVFDGCRVHYTEWHWNYKVIPLQLRASLPLYTLSHIKAIYKHKNIRALILQNPAALNFERDEIKATKHLNWYVYRFPFCHHLPPIKLSPQLTDTWC